MKILNLSHCYSPAVGGVEFFTKKIAENLYSRYGIDSTVFTTNAYNCESFTQLKYKKIFPYYEKINEISVKRFDVNTKISKFLKNWEDFFFDNDFPLKYWIRFLGNGPLSLKMLWSTLNFNNVDIISAASFPMFQMFYAYLSHKLNDIPLVLRGCFHILDDFAFENPIFLEMVKKCSLYLANTEDEKIHLMNNGISENKIKVLGLGVDLKPYKFVTLSEILNFKKKHNIDCNDKIVLFVGQKLDYKGIDILLKSFELVFKKNKNVSLMLCGSSNSYFYPKVLELINKFPFELKLKIHNIDNFEEADKPIIYNCCDLFVLPSIYESFGIAYLEAWAAKKPVIGCNINAVKNLISDNENGFLIEPRNFLELSEKIQILLNDKKLRERMGANGFDLVQKDYTWDIISDKLKQIYETLINN